MITSLFASLLAGFALGQASPIIQFFVAGELSSKYTPGAADGGASAMTEAGGLASNLMSSQVAGQATSPSHSRMLPSVLMLMLALL